MSANVEQAEGKLWTVGQAAQFLGVATWRLQHLYRTKRLPEPARRVGIFRALTSADVERARALLAEQAEPRG
jgi:hypothetical protein